MIKKNSEQPSLTLKKKRERLFAEVPDNKENDSLARHARCLDEYFRESYANGQAGLRITDTYAVIALGGYGRGEQCVHSDVDLLILFNKKVPAEAEKIVRETVYPLWDIGLEVGHATRSVKGCVHLAKSNIEVLTSVLDARFLCGQSSLYAALTEQLHKEILLKIPKKLISRLIKTNCSRHTKFGDSAYLLEPNLKEGQGGLRDYHTMLWIAHVLSDLKQPRDLEFQGYLSNEEFINLNKALRFIWDVRNRLHLITGRKCDQLYLEHQVQLAQDMNFQQKDFQKPVERFMGELHGKMEFVKQLHLMFLYEQGFEYASKRRRKLKKRTSVQGLTILRNRLRFESAEEIVKTPLLLIKIFEESARLKLPLSAEANRLVWEFSFLVNKTFRSSPEAVKSFEKILVAPASTFNVLNEMLRSKFLERFIPQFRAIVNRIQYNEYHIFPVDKHTLRTVQAIKRFSTDKTEDSLSRKVFKNLYKRKLLLWAALLHDIGKGVPGSNHAMQGAVLVQAILEEKGYSSRDIAFVRFLVQEHLLLIKIATRRDLNDEETAIYCARRIKSVRRLKMLYLLTVADSVSTGPKAWNQWTAALLRDLFFKVLSILEKGELATEKTELAVAHKKRQIIESAATPDEREELSALAEQMAQRYWLYISAADMSAHIRLYRRLYDEPFVWEISGKNDPQTRTVTICAQDCPGLFSKIAGVFTLHNLNILDAQAYTWRNHIALDIFKVQVPPDRYFEDEKWMRAQKDLKDALTERLDLAESVNTRILSQRKKSVALSEQPPKIEIDNISSSFFTIIEVFAYDFTGFLFGVADALFKCGLDIQVAKIATNVDQVVDVFYVRDFDGQKADVSEHIEKIKKAIDNVLPGVSLKIVGTDSL
jgi:[protein-PII] uridylyltransferase